MTLAEPIGQLSEGFFDGRRYSLPLSIQSAKSTEAAPMNLTLFDKIMGGGLLAGKKTYLAALALLVGGAIQWLSGEATLVEFITVCGEALGLAGLRAGISKSKGPVLRDWGGPVIAGLMAFFLVACATSQGETPQQRFYGLKSDYSALLQIAVTYKQNCEAKAPQLKFGCDKHVAEVQRIDREVILPALQPADAANKTGQSARLAALNGVLQSALLQLQNYVLKHSLNGQQGLRGPPPLA